MTIKNDLSLCKARAWNGTVLFHHTLFGPLQRLIVKALTKSSQLSLRVRFKVRVENRIGSILRKLQAAIAEAKQLDHSKQAHFERALN